MASLAPPSKKRKASEAALSPKKDDVDDDVQPRDEIITLDVSGRLFRCYRSNLMENWAEGSYFQKRFGNPHLAPGGGYKDEHGKLVYFIDRSSDLFPYILCFLRQGKLNLPPYSENPTLWDNLRDEAAHYFLDSLSDHLKTTYWAKPNERNQGVCYYLGTDRNRSEYTNPYERGEVDVTGWIDFSRTTLVDELLYPSNHYKHYLPLIRSARGDVVQYRPGVAFLYKDEGGRRYLKTNLVSSSVYNSLSLSSPSGKYFPTDIVFKNCTVKPTHYSLRFAQKRKDLETMTHWDFAASVDGETWTTLHQARDDQHLRAPTVEEVKGIMKSIKNLAKKIVKGVEEIVGKLLVDFTEAHYRHTWEIDPQVATNFYRYFRIVGVPRNGGEIVTVATGFELYGEVSEQRME